MGLFDIKRPRLFMAAALAASLLIFYPPLARAEQAAPDLQTETVPDSNTTVNFNGLLEGLADKTKDLKKEPDTNDKRMVRGKEKGTVRQRIQLEAFLVYYYEMEGVHLKAPSNIYYDPVTEEMYIADAGNNMVVVYNKTGMPVFAFGYNGEIKDPKAVMTDRSGRIYVIADSPQKLKIFSYRGELLQVFDFPGVEDADTVVPTALTRDSNGKIYIATLGGNIFVYDESYNLLQRFGDKGRGNGRFTTVMGMAVYDSGEIVVVDALSTPVQVFSPSGQFIRGWGEHSPGPSNFSLPAGVVIDSMGRILIVDVLRQQVSAFTITGVFLGRFSDYGHVLGKLAFPSGLAVNKMGHIYITEQGNSRIQVFRDKTPAFSQKQVPGSKRTERTDPGKTPTAAADTEQRAEAHILRSIPQQEALR